MKRNLRSAEDRPTAVHCRCGALLCTLAPGERLLFLRSVGDVVREVRCSECGRQVRLRITPAPPVLPGQGGA